MLEKLRETSRLVAQRLSHHEQISSVIAFGSVCYGVVNENSDIDLLVICQPEIPDIPQRKILLSEVGEGWEYSAYGSDMFPVVDTHGVVNGTEVEVHYQTFAWIAQVLDEVIGQGAITSDLLPYRPYTLPGLLQRSLVLFDRDNVVEKWKNLVAEYPTALKRNLLTNETLALRRWLSEAKKLGAGEAGEKALREVRESATILLCAVNEVHYPEERRMEKTLLPQLTDVPSKFMQRWMVSLPDQDHQWDYRIDAISALSDDILRMGERCLSMIQETPTMISAKAMEHNAA